MPEYADQTPVSPISPPAAWIGGKKNLSKRLAARISAIPHRTYAEPFVGMGGVFFKRVAKPAAEVINDASGEVANLFRILQRHYPQFMDTIKFQITSRREFERLQRCEPSTLTDLERAARFLYLQKCAFGGKVVGQNFGVSVERPGRFDLTRLAGQLEDIHERLAGVTIENLDWLAFIERYDRPATLFYLDPPYYGNERDYGDCFDRQHFEAMAERLARLKGSFLMTINNRPETRELFGAFSQQPVEVTYTVSTGNTHKAREMIVSSRKLRNG